MSTIIREQGVIGNYNVEDSRANPGAEVIYDFFGGGLRPTRFWIRPPMMTARNLSSGADFQAVGFKARLQRRSGQGRWMTVQISEEIRAIATDQRPAEWPRMQGDLGIGGLHAFDAPGPAPANDLAPFDGGYYRILYTLNWYQPGTESVREGFVTVAVTNHRQTVANPDGPNHFLGYRLTCRSPH
jgi:hypothetical protein